MTRSRTEAEAVKKECDAHACKSRTQLGAATDPVVLGQAHFVMNLRRVIQNFPSCPAREHNTFKVALESVLGHIDQHVDHINVGETGSKQVHSTNYLQSRYGLLHKSLLLGTQSVLCLCLALMKLLRFGHLRTY